MAWDRELLFTQEYIFRIVPDLSVVDLGQTRSAAECELAVADMLVLFHSTLKHKTNLQTLQRRERKVSRGRSFSLSLWVVGFPADWPQNRGLRRANRVHAVRQNRTRWLTRHPARPVCLFTQQLGAKIWIGKPWELCSPFMFSLTFASRCRRWYLLMLHSSAERDRRDPEDSGHLL